MQYSEINSDYLVIGHVTRDIIPGGYTIGGTVTYSSLCASALGKTPTIITSCADDLSVEGINNFRIVIKEARESTTFENIETSSGRKQIVHSVASIIEKTDIPEENREAEIVHLGPVADEIAPNLIEAFPHSFVGLTPQGWMRQKNNNNQVIYKEWDSAQYLLSRANATVLSIEDVCGNEALIQDYATKAKVLAVTEGYNGARVYWNGDVRHFSAPTVDVVDPTGAGDIFATVFFCVLNHTKDPWEASTQAVKIASASVTKTGIKSVPTTKEIRTFQLQVIEGN